MVELDLDRGYTMRRTALLLAIIPLAAVAVAAAGTVSRAKASTGAVSGRITFDGVWTGQGASHFQAVINAFQKRDPGVKVKYKPVGDNLPTVLGTAAAIRARAVVNAAGPWVDEVRRLEDPGAGTSVTLSKGAHLVLERRGEWGAALTIPVDRTRVAFAVPWEGALLLGTTDTPFEGDARDALPTDTDERQIREEVGVALDGATLRIPVRARYAGVRVLPAGAPDTARARRETTFARGPLGVLSVAGGKLTTYRRIALAVLHALRPARGGSRRRSGLVRGSSTSTRASARRGATSRTRRWRRPSTTSRKGARGSRPRPGRDSGGARSRSRAS